MARMDSLAAYHATAESESSAARLATRAGGSNLGHAGFKFVPLPLPIVARSDI